MSVSATVPRRGWVPWPVIAARPRLLLYVAEPDSPALVLRRARFVWEVRRSTSTTSGAKRQLPTIHVYVMNVDSPITITV